MFRLAVLTLCSSLSLLFIPLRSGAQAGKSETTTWRTITLERLEEFSDTSNPLFKDVKTGNRVVLRCQDEGWGTVSLNRVKARVALDRELGLKSWPEIEKALNDKKDAYLKSHRVRAREIFVSTESGPKHPRDDLAFFGDSERGFRFKFESFDACSKVDTATSKFGEVCQVILEVKDGSAKPASSGFARIKSSSCQPKTAHVQSPDFSRDKNQSPKATAK